MTTRAKQTEALASEWVATFRVRLTRAINHVRRAHTVSELALLASRGGGVASLLAADLDEALRYYLAPAAQEAFSAGGRLQAGFLAEDLGRLVAFDPTGYGALRRSGQQAARLVQTLVNEQDLATTEAVLLAGSRGPEAQAKAAIRSIGVSQRQADRLAAYRRALRSQTPAPLETVLDDREERLAGLLLANRIGVISTMTVQEAIHMAALEATRQLVLRGWASDAQFVREWHTREDELVRHSHGPMQGQRRPLDEPFISGAGNHLMYPGDSAAPISDTAHCRCSVIIVSA